MTRAADDLVIVTRTGPVTHLTLNRPDRGNALNGALSAAFVAAALDAVTDDGKVIVISAKGERFCVGGDLRFFLESDDPADYLRRGVTDLENALEKLRLAPKPVVVAVHGAVAGAGLGMMLSGDLIIAATSTVFTTGYTRVGLTPDCGLSWLLPRSVGHHRAMDFLLSARTIDTVIAESWGLVTRTAPDDQVVEEALSVASRLAKYPQFALAESKRLVTASWDQSRPTSGADEVRTIATAISDKTVLKALANFLSK